MFINITLLMKTFNGLTKRTLPITYCYTAFGSTVLWSVLQLTHLIEVPKALEEK